MGNFNIEALLPLLPSWRSFTYWDTLVISKESVISIYLALFHNDFLSLFLRTLDFNSLRTDDNNGFWVPTNTYAKVPGVNVWDNNFVAPLCNLLNIRCFLLKFNLLYFLIFWTIWPYFAKTFDGVESLSILKTESMS